MKRLILVRGLPGSGKSTMAKQLKKEFSEDGNVSVWHYEEDDYFTSPAGTYTYVPEKVEEAHHFCKAHCKWALKYVNKQDVIVIVSNTFTQKWEMKPYIDMAKMYGAELDIFEATGNYQNVHGVPEEVIQKMRDRWETL